MSDTPQPASNSAIDQPLYCANHPKVQTRLRCNRCGKPICTKCARRTPVGFRCPECLHEQQAAFYSATSLDYALAAVAGLVLSAIAAYIMSYLGWFFAIFLGPIIGGIIAESMRRVSQKRRGRWMSWVAAACIVLGALLPVVFGILLIRGFLSNLQPSDFLSMVLSLILGRVNVVYVVLAAITAYARLR